VRLLTSKEQIPEVAAAVSIEATDLAVKYGAVRAHRMRNFFGELRPRLEHVAVAGDQLAVMTGHVRERSKSVDLWFKDKLRMVERLPDSEKPHRIVRAHVLSVARRAVSFGATRHTRQASRLARVRTTFAVRGGAEIYGAVEPQRRRRPPITKPLPSSKRDAGSGTTGGVVGGASRLGASGALFAP
jgi:hypothetical protein